MKRVGIYYASKYGQTAKLAAFLRDRYQEMGALATSFDVRDRYEDFDLMSRDLIIIAAPIYGGKYFRHVRKFILQNWDALQSKDTAFCSLCLAVSPGTPEAEAEALGPIRTFLERVEWKPRWVGSFAGALKYRDYPFVIRLVLKGITRRAGGPTDTSKNYEFTDWEAVSRFARDTMNGIRGGEFDSENFVPGFTPPPEPKIA